MKTLNLQQELKFIHSEKISISDKDSLSFEMLNTAQVLISNYANIETKNLKSFYATIYWMTKFFYMEHFKKIPNANGHIGWKR